MFGIPRRRNEFSTIRDKFERKGRILSKEPTPSLLKKFKEKQRIEKSVLKMTPEETRDFEEVLRERELKERKKTEQRRIKQLRDVGGRFKSEVSRFGTVARQQENISQDQEALHSMFGGGDKIWGTEMQPVKMFHDLNPRQRGDDETARMFGFG